MKTKTTEQQDEQKNYRMKSIKNKTNKKTKNKSKTKAACKQKERQRKLNKHTKMLGRKKRKDKTI